MSSLIYKVKSFLPSSDVCSVTGTVFEVNTKGEESAEQKAAAGKNYFDDETLINSLSLRAGNAFFNDKEDEVSSELLVALLVFGV